MSVLFGILCPSQPSKLFNEVVWALASSSANNKLSSHHLTLRHRASVVSSRPPGLVVASSDVYFGLCINWCWQPLQLTLTAASPALPDSGSVTLSGRSRSWGVRDAHSPRLRSQRSPAPENRESLRGQRNIGVGSLGQASVPGSIWWQRERWGAQPCFPRCGGRGLLAVDCCCCCPLSPSNPLNTIMYPYSIQPP